MSYPPPVYLGEGGEVTARFRAVDTPPDLPRPGGAAASTTARPWRVTRDVQPLNSPIASAPIDIADSSQPKAGAAGTAGCGLKTLQGEGGGSRWRGN